MFAVSMSKRYTACDTGSIFLDFMASMEVVSFILRRIMTAMNSFDENNFHSILDMTKFYVEHRAFILPNPIRNPKR